MNGLGLFQAVVGDKPVSGIDGGDIDRFVAARLAVSAEAIVAKHIRTLKRFFNWAVKRRFAESNPVSQATSLPSETKVRERPSVSEEDLGKLVEAADTEDRRLAMWLAVTTGLDRGVIQRLCTQQVDTEANCIRLQRR